LDVRTFIETEETILSENFIRLPQFDKLFPFKVFIVIIIILQIDEKCQDEIKIQKHIEFAQQYHQSVNHLKDIRPNWILFPKLFQFLNMISVIVIMKKSFCH
jgi:hypothetical protein